MSGWREDSGMVRSEARKKPSTGDPRWDALFDNLEPWAARWGSGMFSLGSMMRAGLGEGRRRVAADPEGSRAEVLDAIRLVVACLQLEPAEVYPPPAKSGA
jgi:hypothetical protein